MYKFFFFLFSVVVSFSIHADDVNKLEEAIRNIDTITALPIDGMSAVKDVSGDIFYVSKNGRYAFKGTMIDVWSKTILDSQEKLAHSINTIDLSNMGINVDEYKPVIIGHGEKVVTVFTDPTCEPCLLLLPEMIALQEEFTFKLLHVPVLGDESKKISASLYCADTQQAFSAVTEQNYKLIDRSTTCDLSGYQKRLLAADIIQVRHVPFLISPDKRVARGKPKSLSIWLKSSS